ncbi:albusnodin/ikarugamycin family macrolactam cyclase [Actinoalloteichus spitiensis]|uniref:albusnodin/ikarugamycin family macrolactam cyclase n=1 Tax=Actinoalloteichus spitiensis TaxID=252394 RepID=UPI0002ECE62C|nr:albusnodin/ikarugamycin family macrolactam cyclase [Actinoalloteichus spitiensis]
MWIGGSSREALKPLSARAIVDGVNNVWVSGVGISRVRVFPRKDYLLLVVGFCGACDDEVAGLSSVPDDIAWRWSGSYIVVRLRGTETTVWTDIGWACPVYTTTVEGTIYWSTSARLLSGLHGGQVNLEHVVDHLTGRAVVDRSWFSRVNRLLPGRKVTIQGKTVRSRAVWRPRIADGCHASRLRRELERAVECRADGARLTTDLSGGLDSSTLALLGAGSCVGVTMHPAGVAVGGDLDYARDVGQLVEQEWVPVTRAHLPYRYLDLVPVTDEPAPSTVTYGFFAYQMLYLRTVLRSRRHLTGDGGDALLITPKSQVGELLRFHPVRALREAARWSSVRARPLRDAFASQRQKRTTPPAWLRPQTPSNGLPPPRLFATSSPTRRAMIDAITRTGRTARADVEIAARFAVDLHNPYCDSRVIDAYHATPIPDLPGPSSYKALLKASVTDLLPDSLRARTTKGDSTPSHFGGLRAAAHELAQMMDGHLHALGLVDLGVFRRDLAYASAGSGSHLHSVETAIATEVWFRAHHRDPLATWCESGGAS